MNVKIPEHWLIDTGVTTYWPHAEGIWVNKDTEPILRFAVVYLGLMDIPEARNELTVCNERFINTHAKILLSFFRPIMQKARQGEKPTTANAPLTTESEEQKAKAIYKPWVDTWALGSDKMLDWVIGANVPEIILNILKGDFNRQDWRRLDSRLTQLASQYSLPWVWKTLISGEYKRLYQAQRALSRYELQNKSYYRRRENIFITHSRLWIAVRIIGVRPKALLDDLASRSSKKDFRLTEADLTGKILKPFDLVFGYNREPGRPVEKDISGNLATKLRQKI